MESRQVEDTLGFVGKLLGDEYFVDGAIGKGAFALVYHAITEDGREVAIKISQIEKRAAIFRFNREIKVMELLPLSPHLVAYKRHGKTADGRLFLAMEYVPGPTLSDGLRSRHVLGPEEAAACVGQIALALQTLHRFSIVHRDLKPSNVLLASNGLVKLFDFGLVLDIQRMLRMFETSDILRGQDFAEEVERGIVVGTPEYMAIEQFEDAKNAGQAPRQTCPASDVFSAGVILYQLITGRGPFPMRYRGSRPTTREIVDYLQWRSRITAIDLVPPPEVDGDLWNIISRALSTVPWMRQQNGKELSNELFGYLASRQARAESRPAVSPKPDPDDTIRQLSGEHPRLTAQELFGDLDLSSSWSIEQPPKPDDQTWASQRGSGANKRP